MFTTVVPNLSTLLTVMAVLFALVSTALSIFAAKNGEQIAACVIGTLIVAVGLGGFMAIYLTSQAAKDNLELINSSGVTVLSDNLGSDSPLIENTTYTDSGNAVSVTVKVDGADTILSCKIVPNGSKTFSVLCEAPEETSSGLIPLDEIVSSK